MKNEETVPPSADNADLRQIVYQKIRDAMHGLIAGEKLSRRNWLTNWLYLARRCARLATTHPERIGRTHPRKEPTQKDRRGHIRFMTRLRWLLAIERLCSKGRPRS